jgi:hypothetical protein
VRRALFRIGTDGNLDVTGTPADPSDAEVFRRTGPYRLQGNQLVAPVFNEEQPILVRFQEGRLHLRFDDTLTFQLQRQ